MSGYSNIPRYVSPKTAIRTALGKIGFQDSMQTLEPDLIEWTAEAQDRISRLKTYTDMNCSPEVQDNKIFLPQEMQLIQCAKLNGVPMTYNPSMDCDRCTKDSPNRCCKSEQFFSLDECYMHFKPTLPNGTIIDIHGMKRPIGNDGYPLVSEVCINAVGDYICAMLCARFNDNRYNLFFSRWLTRCPQARAELNRLSQQQVENLGYRYYRVPVAASHSFIR